MEKNLSYSHKLLGEKKKELKQIQSDKKKIDLPVSAEIENILLKYNISAAAYHGGKLNGVDSRELIRLSKPFFLCFKIIYSPLNTQIGLALKIFISTVPCTQTYVPHWIQFLPRFE